MMTNDRGILKTCLITLSLGCTMGGWALLARHDSQRLADQQAQQHAALAMVERRLDLPPLPPLVPPPAEAMQRQSAPGAALALPPIPTVDAPAPRPPGQELSRPVRPLRPLARTQSSR